MRTPAAACAALLAAAGLAACGNEEADVPRTLVQASAQTTTVKRPAAGLTMVLPKNYARQKLAPPGIFAAGRGRTVVSAYAYNREDEQQPKGKDALEAARERLVSSTKKREKSYRLRSSKATRIAGAPAIELVGDQTISSERVRIRSLHVYKGYVEYVIEMFAPVRQFRRDDPVVMGRIVRTLAVTGKLRAEEQARKKAAAKRKEADSKEKKSKPKKSG